MNTDTPPAMTISELYDAAQARVLKSEALEPYYEVLFFDWSEQYLAWIIKAREEEILDWADSILGEYEQDEW